MAQNGGRRAERPDGETRRNERHKGRKGQHGETRRRNDRGQYVDQMTEDEILALLDRVPGPVIATADVADHFDSTTEGARRKLNDLCDRDVLDRRKVGGTRVYWKVEGVGV
jgi:Mg-chelatase subunit ChlD